MPHITVYDVDGNMHEADVDDATDLLDACESAGVSLPHSCGRGGWCSTCAVKVEQGEIGKDLYPPMGPEELDTLVENNMDPQTQVLSCSCQVYGDVVVRAVGSLE